MLDLLSSLSGARVLVIGDVMLDRYIEGAVNRISPEAPVPVLNVSHETSAPGGAANVAANLAALGAHAILVSVVGADPAGHELRAMMKRYTRIESMLLVDPERTTTVKTRCIAGQHILRIDSEKVEQISDDAARWVVQWAQEQTGKYDAVVFSDYAKGVLVGPHPFRYQAALDLAPPVIVDPKDTDYSRYGRVDLITPNAAELAAATGMRTDTFDEILVAATAGGFVGKILVTRGAQGMVLVDEYGHMTDIPANPVSIADITGAGDTVVAVMGACAAVGADWEQAARLANVAARVVVQKIGTTVARPDEIRAEIERIPWLASEESVADKVARWRREGQSIGFTNGCFDLLHAGHIHLLREARKQCDRLVVAVNTDDSISGIKGDGRPVENVRDRADKLAPYADQVCVFPHATPESMVRQIRPDVLFKGAEYELCAIAGAEHAGRVVLIPMMEGKGTTDTIEKIKGDA